jgi:transglutaminase-like putative cysteine protease
VSIDAAAPAALAEAGRAWVAGRPRGWPQVDAVLAGLRSHARFDRAAVTSSEGDALAAFWEQRSGAAYHFASAAAVLLGEMGYEVRLVGGFYADPASRDERSAQMVVAAEHAHVWCELRLADGAWFPLEPDAGLRRGDHARPADDAAGVVRAGGAGAAPRAAGGRPALRGTAGGRRPPMARDGGRVVHDSVAPPRHAGSGAGARATPRRCSNAGPPLPACAARRR